MTDNIEKWKYFVRQFTNIATRYPLQTTKCNDRTNLIVFANQLDITHFRTIEDLFIKDIRDLKIYKIDLEKLNLFFNDLSSDFFKTIDCYNDWYLKKKEEIEINDEYYFYKTFYESVIMTKEEVVKCNIETNKLNGKPKELAPVEPREENETSKTNQKTQFVILQKLGFFDLKVFEQLTTKQKGEFMAKLLNMNVDNATDYLGNIFYTKGKQSPKSPYNQTSIKQAKEILNLIGIDLDL